MELAFILKVLQVVSALFLIAAILAQRSEASVGGAFGGGDMSETGNIKRRGSERVMFAGTIVLACVFILSIVLSVILV